MKINKLLLLIAPFLCATCYAQSVPLYSFDPAVRGSFNEPADNATWGYSFFVKTPITITHLAWNDTGGDGLSHSHQVGLWRDTSGITQAKWPQTPFPPGGSLLRSATIPAGTSAELVGPWRRVPITPLTLSVGGYSIGGQNNAQSTDNMVYVFMNSQSGPSIDERVLAGSFTLGGQAGFYAPGSPNSTGWYANDGAELGAMVFVLAIPEPSSFALLAVFAAAFSTSIRRRR